MRNKDGPAAPETYLQCRFCDQPARFVLVCVGAYGRISRLKRLAEPVCGRTWCMGPSGSGPSYFGKLGKPVNPAHPCVRKNERYRGYFDIMMGFIHCDRNNDPETYMGGGRWTWVSPEVWVKWLAGTNVRGNLTHASHHE